MTTRAALLRGLLALAVLAGCARSLPQPVRPRPAHPAGAAAAPQPPATAPAAPASPPPARPEPLPAATSAPLLVKVGLASDLAAVTLPCCEGEVTVSSGEQVVAVLSPLRIEPAPGSSQHGFFRLQVSALRDEGQARDLAARLARQTGEPADAHFDAGIDLYRIRLGHYGTREEAEADQKRIGALGVTGAFAVSEGAQVSDPALRLTQRGTVSLLPGRWLAVATAGAPGMRAEGHRYRGRILIYLNDRGSLNLINELPLEEYLRGVVPSEMGPEQYGQLEAQKAQAVAARTYTLKNLGEFSREGYDICATPRCQVYSGMEVEHPLSDRAIAETAGQVLLYKGELVDALYSSTCGGHTEDAEVIFPFKQEPYLKGVPCIEAGTVRLDGDLPAGAAFPDGLTQRLLPPPPNMAPADALAARLERLAQLAGLPPRSPSRARLATLDRREVQRFVASAFDLALDARLLLAPEDVAYLVNDPPPGWSEEDRRRAAYLLRSGLVTGPPDRPLARGEVERMLLAFAELLRVVRRDEVSYLSLAAGRLTVRAGKEEKAYTLPARLATFRKSGEEAAGASLGLVPGDGLTLYWQENLLLAAVQDVDNQGAGYDRSSKWSSWTRFRSDSQIASQVQTRLPGLGYRGFEILSRGVSGRVGKIRIDGEKESVEVEGLAVRWTLDVPDTLFTAKRLEPPHQEPGWLFTGRGWGHGVGMCQVGAYGMALRGHSYRDILLHYYTGVDLGRVRLTGGAGRAAGR